MGELPRIAALLLRSDDLDTSLEGVLARLGETVDVSRAYIFANVDDMDSRLVASQRWEWVLKKSASLSDDPDRKSFVYQEKGFGRWVELLVDSHPVFGPVKDFPVSEQELLTKQGIKSVAVIPIFVAGVWWGFIGLDDCVSERRWSEVIIQMLQTVAELIGAAMERLNVERQLSYWNDFNRNIVESTSVGVFVIDSNARLQVWNRGMEEQFGVPAAEVLGEELFTAFPALENEELGSKIRTALDCEEGFSDPQISHVTRHKGKRILDIKGTPLQDVDGKINGLVLIVSDVTDYWQAEEKLAASEEMYRAISESAVVGVYIYHEDRFLYVNQRMAEITGYEVDDLLSMNTRDLVAADDRERLRNIVERRKSGEDTTPHYSFKIVRKDKREVYIEVHTRGIVYEGIEARLGHCVDITDSIEAQSLLYSSEKLYRSTIDSMSDIIHVVDRDMRIVLHNTSLMLWAAELGLKVGEVIGKGVFKVFPFLPAKVQQEYEEVWRTGKPLVTIEKTELEGKVVFTETRKIPVKNKAGETERIVTVVRDITEREEAAEALKESHQRFLTVLDSLDSGVYVADMETYEILFANKRMQNYFGDILGKTCWKVLQKGKGPCKFCTNDKLLDEKGQPTGVYAWEFRNPISGFWCEIRDRAIRWVDGRMVRLEIAMDITERKLAEKALVESDERWRSLALNTPAFITIVNPQHVIQYINHPVTGLAIEDVVGKSVYDFISPEYHELAKKSIDEVFKTGESGSYASTAAGPHGSISWYENYLGPIKVENKVVAVTIIGVDITERIQTEKALKESEERYRMLFENANDALFVHSITSEGLPGKFIQVNEVACERLGYTREELLQMSPVQLDAPENRKNIPDIMEKLRRENHVVFETNHMAKDGRKIPVEASSHEFDLGGKPLILTIARDITERKKAEQELRESEDRYRSVVETAKDAIVSVDSKGSIIFWNTAAAVMFGYSSEEIIGQSITTIIPKRLRDGHGSGMANMLTRVEPHISGEMMIESALRKDGSEFPVEMSYKTWESDGGISFTVIIRDVTERRRTEAALKESEERYRKLVEHNPAAIAVHCEGKIVYANRAALELVGAEKLDEIEGRSVLSFVHPDYIEIVKERIRKNQEEGRFAEPIEEKFLTLEGKEIDVEVTAIPITYQGKPATQVVFWDITERKKSAEALKESKQLLEKTFASLREAVLIVDAQSGKIIDCNPATCDMFGYLEDEIIGQKPELLHVDKTSQEKFREILIEAVTDKGFLSNFEYTMKRKNGEIISTEHSVIPLTNDKSERIGWVSVMRDITERRQAELALKESEERFRQLAENIDEVFWLTDWINNKVLYVSSAYEQIWGVPGEALISDPRIWSENIHPDDRDRVFTSFKENAEAGLYDEVYRVVREDGSVRWIHDRAFPIHDDEGKVWRMAGISEDITGHKHAEEEAKRHSRELSAILAISTEVSASLDEDEVVNLIAEGAVELIAADGCTVYRYDDRIKELLPRTTTVRKDRDKRLGYHIKIGEGITGRAALERKPILANQVHKSENAVVIPGVKDRSHGLLVAPLIAQGDLWGVMTLIRFGDQHFTDHDLELFAIFANQVADAAVNSTLFSLLGESEEKYRSFVEQATDGIVIIQDGKLVFANQAAARMVGYTLADMVGMDFVNFIAPDVRPQIADRYRRRTAADEVPNVYETRLVTSQGEEIDTELNAGIITYQGKPADLVFARDIRERKQAELRREVRSRLLDNLRSAKTVDECLQLGCEAVRDSRLFKRGVLALQNEYEQIIHLGQVGLDPETVAEIRKTASPDKTPFREMMQECFKISNSYFVPVEAGIDFSSTARYIPQDTQACDVANAWQIGDELFVPVMFPGGTTESYLSVDTPFDGKRPDRVTVQYLEDIIDLVIRQVHSLQSIKALQESEERYRRLIELSPVSILIHQEGKIRFSNPAALRLLGAKHPEQLQDREIADFIHPEYKTTILERIKKISEGDMLTFAEQKFLKLDKSEVFVEAVGIAFTYQGRPAIQVIARDVTERKKAELALQESEENYRNVVERANDGITVVQDSILKYVSPSLAEMLGYDVDEMVNTPFSNYIHPRELPKVSDRYKRRMAGEDVPGVYETILVHKDSGQVSVELNAGIVTFQGKSGDLVFVRDITERKMAQEKEKQYVSNLSFLSQTAMDFVRLTEEENIYRYVCDKVYDLVEEAIVYVASFDEKTEEFVIRSVSGIDKEAQAVMKILGTKPEGMRLTVNPEILQHFLSGKLSGHPVDPEELVVWGISKTAGAALTKLLSLDKLYSVGFVREGKLLGEAVIITRKGSVIKNREILEAFINQASIALQRKQVEDELRSSEIEKAAVLDSMSEHVVYHSPELKIQWANRAAADSLRLKPGDLEGRQCYELWHGRNSPCPVCPVIKARDTGKVQEAEIETPDGRGWFVRGYPVKDKEGKVVAMVEVTLEITERKKAQEALINSEERYRRLFEDSPISLWEEDLSGVRSYIDGLKQKGVADFEKYFPQNIDEVISCASQVKVIDVNKATVDLYEASSKQELQGNLGKVLDEETIPALIYQLSNLARGKTELELETVNRTLTGEKKMLNLRLMIAPGYEETWEKVLVSIFDITERKRVEEALRESEEFSRTVIEGSPLGISVRDPKGKLLSVNLAWRKIWAVPEKEIMRDMSRQRTELSFDETDDYLARWQDEVKRVYTQGGDLHIPEIEITSPRAGGARWISQYFYAISDSGGQVERVVILTEDITERKQTEEAFRESQRALTTLMSNLPGMAYRCRNDKNWTMEFVSEGCINLTGYRPEDLVNNRAISFGQVIHPEDREMAWNVIQEALSERNPYQLAYRIITADWKEKWVWEMGRGVFDSSGELLALEGFISDITDRKRAEEALRESEELYRSLIETSPDSITLTDLEGKFIMANRRAAALYGVEKPESLIGTSAFDVIAPEDRERAYENTGKVLKEGRITDVEYTLLKKDGTRYPGEMSVSLIVDAVDKPRGFLGVVRDISERKQAERALEREHRAFRAIAEAAVHAADIPDLCQRVLSGIAVTFNFTYGTIQLYDETNNNLYLKAVVNPHDHAPVDQSLPQSLDDSRYVGVFAARSGEPILAADVDRVDKLKPYWPRLKRLSVHSIISWPIQGAAGNLLGVLQMWSREPVDITDRDRSLFERIFSMFATVLERKRAEEALRDREEHYRTLVNTAQEGISLVDETERFLYVNPKMAELMGYQPQELVGKNLLDFIPEEDYEFIKEETSIRIKGSTSRYEATLIRSDNTLLRVLVTGAPIFDAEGKFYATLGVLTDITEIKKVEEELRLRLIYQTGYAQIMNKAISMVEFDTFIYECLEILGNAFNVSRVYLAADYGEQGLSRVTHEWAKRDVPSVMGNEYRYADIPHLHERILKDELIADSVSLFPSQEAKAFSHHGAKSMIIAPIHSRSGFYGYIAADDCLKEDRMWSGSEIEAFRTSIRLLTTVIDRYFEEQERRLAEEARLESEQRYRTLVETSADIIFLLSPSGQPLYVSPAVESLGYKPQEILNNPLIVRDAIPADEFSMLGAIFSKAIDDRQSVSNVDVEVLDTKGNLHWISASWNIITDDTGQVLAIQGVARDITVRKKAEQALRLRVEYENVLFDISSQFLSEGVSSASLSQFLERLGRVTQVSRVYLFEHRYDEEGRALMKRTHRWVAEDCPQLDNDSMNEIYYDEGLSRWHELSTGEAIQDKVSDLTEEERVIFDRESIRAILVLPIFVEGKFWGAIGFDEAKTEREWSVEDIRLLWTASQIFSSALVTESKARELARSYDDLQERERQITALNIRLVQAEEDERLRIARVLHDEIAQQLTGVSLVLSAPDLNKSKKVKGAIDEARTMVKETQKFIRDLSYELRPPALDNLGLVAAVRALARSAAAGSGVSFELEGEEGIPRTDPDTEIMLYRIIQEAVTNALKHAESEEIVIRFEYAEPLLRVSIRDDGKGFDVNEVLARSAGLGLRSMRERMSLIQGTVTWVSSPPGGGTEVKLEVEIRPKTDRMQVEE